MPTTRDTPSLARLVRAGDWTGLEDAWTEWILGEADPAPALEALEAAGARKEIPRCLPCVREHAEMLASQDRAAEAAELVGTAMLLGGSPGELARPLWKYTQAAWGEEEFFEAFTEIADLRENSQDMRGAWRSFRRLLLLGPGRAVYHAKGWGLGAIEELDPRAREVTVRFTSGRRDRFPYLTAIEIFELLEDGDLRALLVQDADELSRRLSEEPLEVLRWVLRRSNGRTNHAGIKLALGTLGVEGGRFTVWWRKARRKAETSPWFELSGPANRVQVRLLDQAADPAEGLRRQLGRSHGLGEALTRAKAILAGKDLPEELRTAALETLEELTADEDHPLSQRLAVGLFLREERGGTPETLRKRLERAANAPTPTDPSQPPALWALFQLVPGLREQERCIELLREVHPEDWRDEAARHLPHAAPGMARPLVDELDRSGQRDALVAHYATLLVRPVRNPSALVSLAEHIEKAQDDPALPPPLQRTQCLLQLAVHLYRNAPGDPVLVRARGRLTDLLAKGRPSLLARLLADADVDAFRGLVNQVEGNVEGKLDRLFTRVAVDSCPDVFRGDERPFWELEGTWTTREGLAAREAELRELKDVKIPANAEAIGKAASFGDLSENSEWEAAIEEQRHLTNRAMELEAAVREAQLLENAAVPADTVAPGTAVRYRDTGAGTEHDIQILGPWDSAEGIVSYRSPLAAGMLGLHPGDRATIELPTGTVSVEVLTVVPLDL